MSNHPYGLRGDPFASPATLSAKDASRLIRRRVRAFNGDGGALFPIPTCDQIHELAGGIPDAMLELAGSALRIAAAEGAPAVSPDHVRRAVASAPTAEAAPAPAPAARGAKRAGRASSAPAEADIEADGETPGDEAAIRPDAEALVPAASVEVAAEDEPAAAAIDFDDPDLPPFHPATIALPTQPSENLDPGARDWVSRFIPASGAAPAVVAEAPSAPARATRGPAPEG
ncbi:MAG: hypothetical protein ACRENJ_07805, partial [Candidatus Eiseniibacteriota bacterium]